MRRTILGAIFLVLLFVFAMLVPGANGQEHDPVKKRYKHQVMQNRPDQGSAPTLSLVSASAAPLRNGDPMDVTVLATASEPCTFEITVIYASSYNYLGHDYSYNDTEPGAPNTTYYDWKTAANGSHVHETKTLTNDLGAGQAIEIGPRVYHTDTWYARVRCKNADGVWSQPTLTTVSEIDMPFDEPAATWDDGYGEVIVHIGSMYPTQYGLGSIAQFAEGAGIWWSGEFNYEGPYTPQGEDHIVDRIRAVSGSNNKWVVSFTNTQPKLDNTYPVKSRIYYGLMAQAEISGQENWIVRDKYGTKVSSDAGGSSCLLNFYEFDAVDWYVDQLIIEWNHCENREPDVGFCFDVYELTGGFPCADPDDGDGIPNDSFLTVADCDGDGIVFEQDSAEQAQHILGRIRFMTRYRSEVAASDAETDVGDYFILGGNSVSAKSYEPLLETMDFVMHEHIALPANLSTQFIIYNGNWWDESDNELEIWKYALSTDYSREIPDAHYLMTPYLESIDYPQDGMVQAFEYLGDYMHQTGRPPIHMLESQSGHTHKINHDCDDGTTAEIAYPLHVHPEALEVVSLLVDDHYFVSIKYDATSWPRQPWSMTRDGYDDMNPIGTPTEAMQRDGNGYYSRTYTNGYVEVFIDEVTWDGLGTRTICGEETDDPGEETYFTSWPSQPEWQVTVGGSVIRESPNWVAPVAGKTLNVVTLLDDAVENSTQRLSVSVVEAGTWWWRWRGVAGAASDPSIACESWVGPPTYGSWSGWASRTTALVNYNTGLTEQNNLWNGVQVEISSVDGGPATDSDCGSFKTPK